MSVSALYTLKCIVTETPDLALDNATDVPFDHDIGTTTGTLDASSTVPATKTASDTTTVSAGSLNLTTLTGPLASSVSFSGLKVQLVYITCPSTNTGGVTFDVGAANGYNLFGADNASNESIEVMPGGAVLIYHPNNAEDVDATHKSIDVSGTAGNTYNYVLVAG
jgi:hypothetical protein